jgi:hypothetical protein
MGKHRPLLVLLLALPLVAGACGAGSAADDEAGPRPVSVTHLESTNTDLIRVTPKAAQRLDIQTAPVHVDADGSKRIRIPYAAVLYDPDGQTWTYTSPRSRVYTRENIVVDHVAGGTAILKKGPPPGAQVVTVGATELWGVVYGGIHED